MTVKTNQQVNVLVQSGKSYIKPPLKHCKALPHACLNSDIEFGGQIMYNYQRSYRLCTISNIRAFLDRETNPTSPLCHTLNAFTPSKLRVTGAYKRNGTIKIFCT